MNRKWSMLIVLAILTAFAVYQNAGSEGRSSVSAASLEAKPKAGYAAPAFELPDLEEQTVAFGGGGDRLTLINFWASWCGPCVLEAPDLQQLHERYGDKLLLLGVNATDYDREREARAFVDEQGLTFPILMDREGDVTDLYRVAQFPTSLLVDKNGVIRERIVGVIPRVQWEALIEKWM